MLEQIARQAAFTTSIIFPGENFMELKATAFVNIVCIVGIVGLIIANV